MCRAAALTPVATVAPKTTTSLPRTPTAPAPRDLLSRRPEVSRSASTRPSRTGAGGGARPLIVFDWDDTLFPTSALLNLRQDLGSPAPRPGTKLYEALQIQAEEVLATLKVAKALGSVMIITAAEEGWVQQTCAKFLPAVLPAMQGPRAWVKVISARSTYEPLGYAGSFAWKAKAFTAAVRQHFAAAPLSGVRHVVSIGDADYERQALKGCTGAAGYLGKSLRLLRSPSLARITEEAALIRGALEHLCTHDGHLDLQMEPKW
mmetsp:Transcript_124791/g.285918  ORF Transcript_124791/g.285918 Transcript_124791/m.285918 type:complete len:262 (-) Transcript_124791:303-1088(-)